MDETNRQNGGTFEEKMITNQYAFVVLNKQVRVKFNAEKSRKM